MSLLLCVINPIARYGLQWLPYSRVWSSPIARYGLQWLPYRRVWSSPIARYELQWLPYPLWITVPARLTRNAIASTEVRTVSDFRVCTWNHLVTGGHIMIWAPGISFTLRMVMNYWPDNLNVWNRCEWSKSYAIYVPYIHCTASKATKEIWTHNLRKCN